MAPRLPESFKEFQKRLKQALAGGAAEIRFGRHHHDRAVCREGELWRVRRLEATPEECEACRQEEGYFMPEHLEAIAKPRTLLFETASYEELLAHLRSLPNWD